MPVKNIVLFFLGFVLTLNLSAQQQTADIGIFAGGALPFSDYSHVKVFRSTGVNAGAFYRHNFNSRIALRINALYGRVGAIGYLNNTDNQISFRKNVFDLSALVEINYNDFLLGVDKMRFAPYVFTGFGLSFFPGSNQNFVISPNIPIGVGVKYAITKKIGIGAEISTRKLMNDELDNLNNPYTEVNLPKASDIIHNNDWINYFGLTLTYKFYMGKTPCPAYNSLYD
ncbi:MAG TPA: DUF6089 family protein [Prolixibacteraceae bacterium]|nr:DUF6089 family protein [Prolixibacteraceae bacterium]